MKNLRKRMLVYFTLVNTLLAVILLFVFVHLTQTQFTRQQEATVAEQMDVITENLLNSENEIETGQDLLDEVEVISNYLYERVTLIGPDGELLFDTAVDINQADNHADREEFIEARDHAVSATASRQSESTGELMFYAAQAIHNSQGDLLGVLRISNSTQNFDSIITYLTGVIGLAILFIIAATVYMTYYWSNKITKPVDEIRMVTNNLAHKDYQARYQMESYDEIDDLGHSINYLADQLESQRSEIEQSDRRLSTLIDNLVVGVILVNEDREITVCNPVVNEILGVNLYQQIGREYTDIIQSSEIIHLVEKAIRKNKAQNKEVTLYLQNEQRVDVNVIPIPGKDGSHNYVILLYNITEIKRLEQVRTDFVANVSHELRTPITALKGFSETLLDGAMEDRDLLVEFLEIMLKESTRLDTMVQDILQLSRLERKPNKYVAGSVNVGRLVKEVMQILQQKAENKQILLTDQNDAGKDIIVRANQDELKQVLINLIANAIAYTPENGKVLTRISVNSTEGVIEVIDNGIGIPDKDKVRVFERFYRVDKARSRNAGGTGLGLSIVKWLVEGMDGRLELESELGKGSTFRVLIPLQSDE